MRFQSRSFREPPEINFIPLIDVLLVILIFLMVTTTYSRFAELQINLPTAEAGAPPPARPAQIDVAVDPRGKYMINKSPVVYGGPEAFSQALKNAAGNMKEPVIVISADANSPHQSVINVMEAARIAGYGKITFTTRSEKK
jgi:biopolymer transport protein ExbD